MRLAGERNPNRKSFVSKKGTGYREPWSKCQEGGPAFGRYLHVSITTWSSFVEETVKSYAWPSRVPSLRGNRGVICHLKLRVADLSLEERRWPAGGPNLTGSRAVGADMVAITACSGPLHQRLMETCSDVLLRHVPPWLLLRTPRSSFLTRIPHPSLILFIYFSCGCSCRSVCSRLTRALQWNSR